MMLTHRHTRRLIATMLASTSLALAGATIAQANDTGSSASSATTYPSTTTPSAAPLSPSATSPRAGTTGNRSNATDSSGAALAPRGMTPNRAELPDSAFGKLDATGKGYLTPSDTSSLQGFDFSTYDRNHDGRLTQDEFDQAWQSYSTQSPGGGRSMTPSGR